MYKILYVRKRPKARRSGGVNDLSVVYLPASWQGKRVCVLEEKCIRKLLVSNNQLKRKIKKAVNLLFKG